ncbi:MAG: hypothetical protein AUH78_13235 [Gemmatimonadetes bacterium 13_1_40CM_4_69_8]|nr:MAG: hypothetical protein AUH78_13235 [Gemmatimonadetes bacterium 13_1_40CM_4_69_8]
MEIRSRAAETQIQVVHVPQKPATADPDAVVTAFRDDLARGAADEQRGEVDPGIDGQLQRTPESAVHLHDDLTACRQLPLALDHGHAIPAERLEQAEAGTHQPLVERDAFAVNTDTAGGRLLPQPAMGEHGHRPTAPAQREEPPGKADAGSAASARRHATALATSVTVVLRRVPPIATTERCGLTTAGKKAASGTARSLSSRVATSRVSGTSKPHARARVSTCALSEAAR